MSRTHQLNSSIAARDFAKATIKRAEAELLSKQAALAKAEVDVRVAEADLKVAESEERRLKAWVGYLTLTAPYDGVITARNANTFDFVLPNTGDPSASSRSPQHLAERGRRADLRGRPHRQGPDLRGRAGAGRELRPGRHQGDGADQGIPRRADPGRGHPHLLGAEHEEPHAPRRDRHPQPRQPAPAGDVRLRQGDHRAAGREGAARVGTDLLGRPGLLLDLRGRSRGADRGPHGRGRRRVDRGHQSPWSRRPSRAPTPGCRSTARSR